MIKIRTLLLVSLVGLLEGVVALGACTTVSAPSPLPSIMSSPVVTPSLSWQQIATNERGIIKNSVDYGIPQLTIITNQQTVQSLKGSIDSQHLKLIAEIDFNKYIVGVVFQGQQPSTGYY